MGKGAYAVRYSGRDKEWRSIPRATTRVSYLEQLQEPLILTLLLSTNEIAHVPGHPTRGLSS